MILCVMISEYNGEGPPTSLRHLPQAVMCRMTMRGFTSSDYLNRKNEFEMYVDDLIALGKVFSRSTGFEGLKSAPEAFLVFSRARTRENDHMTLATSGGSSMLCFCRTLRSGD
jgi:NADPH-dependent curcumin reductase CurA